MSRLEDGCSLCGDTDEHCLACHGADVPHECSSMVRMIRSRSAVPARSPPDAVPLPKAEIGPRWLRELRDDLAGMAHVVWPFMLWLLFIERAWIKNAEAGFMAAVAAAGALCALRILRYLNSRSFVSEDGTDRSGRTGRKSLD